MPDGRVLVHNQVVPVAERNGARGSRYWLQLPQPRSLRLRIGARAEVPRPVGKVQLLAGRLPVAVQCIGLAGLAVGPPVLLIQRCGFESHRVDCGGRSTRLFETPASPQSWARRRRPSARVSKFLLTSDIRRGSL